MIPRDAKGAGGISAGDTGTTGERDVSANGLYEHFRQVALRAPDGIAVREDNSQLTYEELLSQVDAFCESLRAAGTRPLQHIALILGNSTSFIVAVLAAWKLQAVAVPLSPLLLEGELLQYFSDDCPGTVVAPLKKKAIVSALQAAGAAIDHAWFHTSPQAGWIYEGSSRSIEHDTGETSGAHRGADCAALTQYSTGSTGKPKRVTRTHEQLLGEFISVSDILNLRPSDRVLGAVPFYHSHGLKNAAMLPVFNGATLYVMDNFFPRDVARMIERERITVYPGVPFMFQQLAALRGRYDFSSLRMALSGTAVLPQRVADAFERAYSIKIRRVYGTTETGLITVEREPTGFDALNRVGVPIPGVTVQIVDQDGEPVPLGEEGRVKVNSPFSASKYDNSRGSSGSYFEGESYFPGDLGSMSAGGELVLSGRHRGFINIGGNKVDPAEVEAALLELSGISEAVVLGVPDEAVGEKVKAVLVASAAVSANDVRAHLAARLTAFKHPRIIEFRKELPRSPLGKVIRANLLNEPS